MKIVPVQPFLPMHEEILDALAKPGAVYFCLDPDERWAPYLRAMIDAGWLGHLDFAGGSKFWITEEGRRFREVLTLGQPPL